MLWIFTRLTPLTPAPYRHLVVLETGMFQAKDSLVCAEKDSCFDIVSIPHFGTLK